MITNPLSQIVEIPDALLNEKLVAVNDNEVPAALSREHLEAESILARDDIEPGRGPFFLAGILCLLLGLFIIGLLYQLA